LAAFPGVRQLGGWRVLQRLAEFLGKERLDRALSLIGDRPQDRGCLDGRGDVMNEKDQKPDRHERQQQRESDREERHEARAIVFRAATDRPQHDKAVGENCHEHAEHKLIGPIAHEIAQDARGVLRRGERERDDGDRESDPSHGNHRTSDGSEHATRAFRTGIEQGLPAFCGERFGACSS